MKTDGAFCEALAQEFLEKKGFQLIQRNYRCKIGEIDLLFHHGKELVFVEVKSKRDTLQGYPEEMVGPKKQSKIRRIAEFYLQDKNLSQESFIRFDVVAILFDPEGIPHIRHIPAAF